MQHGGGSKDEDEDVNDDNDGDDVIFVKVEQNSSSVTEDVKSSPVADEVQVV